mmetsp:Transcript_4451/g.19055  ORF Transcript_4451/g.19055 Transcript_4451/m.19055 type:complete len:204 (+) Transcript_4451:189-800(+)|eukprot:CAMPEP_0113965684 /NCGR_PEP_ID=MMETSP0011_2-20120614/7886_1 /TAXON_ID=101924 /ORGANISM="Rhodosorus marinus" /LENGTH=203 /DNA_ID=CAMNT_0000978233 /DNA_START=164 /DNA_END=775 /DNA_ORIENTATION=- /assembly_acc=CAM_ASM_000156
MESLSKLPVLDELLEVSRVSKLFGKLGGADLDASRRDFVSSRKSKSTDFKSRAKDSAVESWRRSGKMRSSDFKSNYETWVKSDISDGSSVESDGFRSNSRGWSHDLWKRDGVLSALKVSEDLGSGDEVQDLPMSPVSSSSTVKSIELEKVAKAQISPTPLLMLLSLLMLVLLVFFSVEALESTEFAEFERNLLESAASRASNM